MVLKPYLKNKWSDETWTTLLSMAENAMCTKPLTALINDPEQDIISPESIKQSYGKVIGNWPVAEKSHIHWSKICHKWQTEMLESILRESRDSIKDQEPKLGQAVLVKSEKGRNNYSKAIIRNNLL